MSRLPRYATLLATFALVILASLGCSRSSTTDSNTTGMLLPANEARMEVTDRGHGPQMRGDQYEKIDENPLVAVADEPLSTFSIDVDTASYSNVRRFLLDKQLPPKSAIRIEEMVNYFEYDYAPPHENDLAPFSTDIEVATCPWQPSNRLVRIGLQGRRIAADERPASNLVFLLDVSGSMHSQDRLPLLKQGLTRMLDQLNENDRVAVVVYAGASGVVLPSTSASDRHAIRTAIGRLRAGGSTNGASGIQLAYEIASQNYIEGGCNRVLLATDGDFNVGVTGNGALIDLVEHHAQSNIFLTVLGFGRGNLNDSMMEQISNRGNGNYAYIDSIREAQRVLVDQIGGTLVTIAKDVKIQVEFNPAAVASYRLVGYENRVLANQDFNDDQKDAGEIGAGHQVTAIYEVVPVGGNDAEQPEVDDLVFQSSRVPSGRANDGELLLLKVRYKLPESTTSQLLKFSCKNESVAFGNASAEFQFAVAVAEFGMLLRDSKYAGEASYSDVLDHAQMGLGEDARGYRKEFMDLVLSAKRYYASRRYLSVRNALDKPR